MGKMKNLIDNLLALQEALWDSSKTAPKHPEQLVALRAQIPPSFLSTFDSFVARKKKPVSVVRRGVCSECHLQIAVGTLGSLAFGQGVQKCGNCDRFIYLPEDESVLAPESASKTKGVQSKKETAVHAERSH